MTPASSLELQELKTEIALFNQKITSQDRLIIEKFGNFEKALDRIGSDHENRLRTMQSKQVEMELEIAQIKARATTFNLIQTTLAALAASVAYLLSK